MPGKRPPCHARVVTCLCSAAKYAGDVWTRRRLLVVQLTCGHLLRKRSFRRYLVGESLRCPQCEREADRSQPALPRESVE